MTRKLNDSVIVITGASSGIGQAAALRLAKRGASLALAARRESELSRVAAECMELGARTIVVAIDVSDELAVQVLARAAVLQFGRIDAWVNNAAVTAFGSFETMPSEVYRQVIETNLFGYIHGTRTALPYLRESGGGVIVNVASVVSEVPHPWASAYVISKHGVRALGRCVRQELRLQGEDDIHVVTLLPSTIDTPLFQNAANYVGRSIVAMPPVNDPDVVARAIERAIVRPRREVPVGKYARRGIIGARLFPGVVERRMAKSVDRKHLSDEPAAPRTGNVLVPGFVPGTIRGGWQKKGRTALFVGAALALGTALTWAGLNTDRRTRRQIRRYSRDAWKNLEPRVQQLRESFV